VEKNEKHKFMQKVIEMAIRNVEEGKGGPFAAIIVKNGKIIAEGTNMVTSANDPSAHAEITAIRRACKTLKTFHLEDCEIYTSCEPCPMCLGAIYWARISKIYYDCNRKDASEAGFDDSKFYEEVCKRPPDRSIKMEKLLSEEGKKAFDKWLQKEDRIPY